VRICTESLLSGARRARGTAVIIDVYRAFTTAAVALARGARRLLLVPDVAEALALREQGVGDLCAGEVHGVRPEGFDFNNSPFELSRAEVAGRTVILSTRAGTVGAAAATGAERLYAGALVTARATARAILREAPERVTLVAMGWEGRRRSDEDERCAEYLRDLLEGRAPDRERVRRAVLAAPESRKFDDPAQPHFRPEDRDIALQVDRFDFAIRIVRERGRLAAKAVAAPSETTPSGHPRP